MKDMLLAILKPGGRTSLLLIGLIAVMIAALGYFNLLEPIGKALESDALTFKIGAVKISLYRILSGIFGLFVLLWSASLVSGLVEKAMGGINWLESSNRALLTKAIQVLLYFILSMLTLDLLGTDLTAFAVFGGALGVGLGLGLQKVTANFISGVILLVEKSIKNGDMVDLGNGVAGIVRRTGTRFTLIEGSDGGEIMVPNDDFITNRVTNWTYSHRDARVNIRLSVSYGSDIDLAQKLMLASAHAHPSCSQERPVNCFLQEFGADGISFSLSFWVNDIISDGRSKPRSEVMQSIVRAFRAHGVEMTASKREAPRAV
ncbi:MAG: mechanosensitive ion channel [Alphaproteobacteria bacterium]|nr:mechanosensitive ion channel [Alphaproteobacteria bacterium]